MRITFMCFLSIGFLLALTATAASLDKVHPALQARMMAAEEGEYIPVTIRMMEQFDAYEFMDRTRMLSKEERKG